MPFDDLTCIRNSITLLLGGASSSAAELGAAPKRAAAIRMKRSFRGWPGLTLRGSCTLDSLDAAGEDSLEAFVAVDASEGSRKLVGSSGRALSNRGARAARIGLPSTWPGQRARGVLRPPSEWRSWRGTDRGSKPGPAPACPPRALGSPCWNRHWSRPSERRALPHHRGRTRPRGRSPGSKSEALERRWPGAPSPVDPPMLRAPRAGRTLAPTNRGSSRRAAFLRRSGPRRREAA